MTQFDYIVLVVVMLSVLLGWWRGLVYEVLSLLSWVTSYFVAKSWAAEVAPYMPEVLESEALKSAAAFIAVFVTTFILCGIAAWALNKLIKSFGLDWRTNGVLGALFGFLQLHGVRQVAVMSKHNAKWRIDIKRLGFVVVDRRAGSRVTHMRNTGIAGQRAHIARAEYIMRQAVAFVQVESITFQRGNTCRILPAVLQHLQSVIQQLIYRASRNHT